MFDTKMSMDFSSTTATTTTLYNNKTLNNLLQQTVSLLQDDTATTTTTFQHPTQHIQALDTRDVILISCFAAIFIIGVAGNLLVFYVFVHRNTSALSTMELLIVFLACADLVASIFNPMMFVYWTMTFHKVYVRIKQQLGYSLFTPVLCLLYNSIQFFNNMSLSWLGFFD